jgi:hypothetical protein
MGGAVARVASVVKPSKPAVAPAPTQAEISQVTATSMDGYDSRRTKRRGRSATIMTGPMGVEEQQVTLGTKSLLGQ